MRKGFKKKEKAVVKKIRKKEKWENVHSRCYKVLLQFIKGEAICLKLITIKYVSWKEQQKKKGKGEEKSS